MRLISLNDKEVFTDVQFLFPFAGKAGFVVLLLSAYHMHGRWEL